MHKLRRFLHLDRQQKAWVLRAWCWLPVFWVSLRTRPFPKVAALAKTWAATAPGDSDIATLDGCVRAAASAHLLPMRCLERSLTLQRLLRREGLDAELQIGVDKQGDTLSAHAWIEVDGEPIGEPEAIADRYRPLIGKNAFH